MVERKKCFIVSVVLSIFLFSMGSVLASSPTQVVVDLSATSDSDYTESSGGHNMSSYGTSTSSSMSDIEGKLKTGEITANHTVGSISLISTDVHNFHSGDVFDNNQSSFSIESGISAKSFLNMDGKYPFMNNNGLQDISGNFHANGSAFTKNEPYGDLDTIGSNSAYVSGMGHGSFAGEENFRVMDGDAGNYFNVASNYNTYGHSISTAQTYNIDDMKYDQLESSFRIESELISDRIYNSDSHGLAFNYGQLYGSNYISGYGVANSIQELGDDRCSSNVNGSFRNRQNIGHDMNGSLSGNSYTSVVTSNNMNGQAMFSHGFIHAESESN